MNRIVLVSIMAFGCGATTSKQEYRRYEAVVLAVDPGRRAALAGNYLAAYPDGRYRGEVGRIARVSSPTAEPRRAAVRLPPPRPRSRSRVRGLAKVARVVRPQEPPTAPSEVPSARTTDAEAARTVFAAAIEPDVVTCSEGWSTTSGTLVVRVTFGAANEIVAAEALPGFNVDEARCITNSVLLGGWERRVRAPVPRWAGLTFTLPFSITHRHGARPAVTLLGMTENEARQTLAQAQAELGRGETEIEARRDAAHRAREDAAAGRAARVEAARAEVAAKRAARAEAVRAAREQAATERAARREADRRARAAAAEARRREEATRREVAGRRAAEAVTSRARERLAARGCRALDRDYAASRLNTSPEIIDRLDASIYSPLHCQASAGVTAELVAEGVVTNLNTCGFRVNIQALIDAAEAGRSLDLPEEGEEASAILGIDSALMSPMIHLHCENRMLGEVTVEYDDDGNGTVDRNLRLPRFPGL